MLLKWPLHCIVRPVLHFMMTITRNCDIVQLQVRKSSQLRRSGAQRPAFAADFAYLCLPFPKHIRQALEDTTLLLRTALLPPPHWLPARVI